MKLVKYSPVDHFSDLFDHFDRLTAGLTPGGMAVDENDGGDIFRLPKTNIAENDKAFVFTLEMPGIPKANVDVSLDGDILTVTGEVSNETEDKSGNVLRREIRSSKFQRRFNLGKEVDRENIKAKMEDGVLTVTAPKAAAAVGRKVSVS